MSVDIMRQCDDIGTVIALDVSTAIPMTATHCYGGDLSGWKVLGRRLNPLKPSYDVPSIVKMMIQSTLIRSTELTDQTKQMADLYFKLPVEQFGLLDFNQLVPLAEVGYEYTRERIEELRFDDAG